MRSRSRWRQMRFNHLRRRQFITLLGGAAVAWPLAAGAQQGERMQRIGVLMAFAESDPRAQAWVGAFREGLQKLGWVEGRSTGIDTRWATADVEAIQRFAKELIALQPELVLSSSTPTTAALLQQTRTIPIIFLNHVDPVGSGFVASFPRPGGNATGFVNVDSTMAGKWLELLKEIAPRVARVAMLFNPATAPYFEYFLNPFMAAAASFAVEAIAAPVRDASELKSVVAAHGARNSSLIVNRNPSCPAIARRSHHWRLATVCLPSIRSVSSLNLAACCPTEMIGSTVIGAQRPMRSHPQGGEAERASGPGPGQVRAGDQPQDRQRARSRRAFASPAARRRGDRVALRSACQFGHSRIAARESAMGVRRDKAALSSGCKPHPATAPAGSNRSSHGGNEVAEAFG